MTTDLRELKAELLRAEIRIKQAKAEREELTLKSEREADALSSVSAFELRTLNVYGPIINSDMHGLRVDGWLRLLGQWEALDPGCTITVNLNSPGGSVLDGFALYDALARMRRRGHQIVTRGQGLVASMATLIFAVGDERIADVNAQFLIHEISANSGFTKITGMRDETEFLEGLNKRLMGILADRSALSAEDIMERCARREWYLSSEQYLEHGFADRIE